MSEAESGKLHTLTEVSNLTKISMPTLQRYKKLYQARIPSVGAGRSQRYPEEALAVFLELKQENIGRRGRPRGSTKKRAAKKPVRAAKAPARAKRGRPKKVAAKAAAKPAEKLLTLTEIAHTTGISYPTLLRYVKSHLKEIPHRGQGRARRFLPAAVEVFKRLRKESGRGRGRPPKKAAVAKRRGPGRPRKAAVAAAPAKRRGRPPASVSEAALKGRLAELEKSQKQLERKLAKFEKELSKPFRVTLKRK